MEWILAGLTFGFLGSFHCVGMCGPLALALPGEARRDAAFIGGRLLYNAGRVFTYTALGMAAGLLSRAFSLAGLQQGLSIGAGALLLLGPLLPALRRQANRWKAMPARWVSRASRPLKELFRHENPFSLLAIGLLNGLLPCGFVYTALLAAVTLGDARAGAVFMLGFGLGTVPAMLGVSLAGGLVPVEFRERVQRWSPWFVAAVGVLLVLRGLGLGIPFLSPVY
ncbi:MAG: sulfite exporter TauE/SafE family protein [Balneolaceae bacterium]|nr:sulfite exporter TauE/SafE family protein [Balneolaceae bacterium]